MEGTKKQKMDMSKAIVEAIYSMHPPGRFLKKCPGDGGEWKELSKREAADRAAQAMAYIIRGESLKEKRRESRQLSRLPPSSQPQATGTASSQTSDRPAQLQLNATNIINHVGGADSSSVAHGLPARRSAAAAAGANNDDVQSAGEQLPGNSNLQQHPHRWQQQPSTTTNLPSTSGIHLNNLESVQVLPPASLQGLTQQLNHYHHHHHEQQQHQQQLLLQLAFGSVPPNSSLFAAPRLSEQGALLSSERYLGGSQQATNNNLLHYQVQPQPNAYLLNVQRNNVGTTAAPQGDRRMPLQTRTQFLISSLSNPSNDYHFLHQQQLQPQPDPLHHQWQSALRPPLPASLNSAVEMLSANHRAVPFPSSSREEESGKQRR
jgi:hypothetical protein